MYIPIFVKMMIGEIEFGFARRFLLPGLAICGCIFMVVAAVDKFNGSGLWQYLLVYAAFMAVGMLFAIKKKGAPG